MFRRSIQGAMFTVLLCVSAACSTDGDTSPQMSTGTGAIAVTDSTTAVSSAPTSGGPCTKADERADIDGAQHICMVKTGKTLVWTPENTPSSSGDGTPGQQGMASSADIPKVIESWGFDLRPFDPSTGMAGLMKITGARTPEPDPTNPMDSRYLFIDYGKGDGGSTDLQMAFFLPLGTPVLAMVDGVVCDVPKLYSGDYSVRIAAPGTPCTISGTGETAQGQAAVLFETEHVLDPLVKVGDTVVAGQQVATVSDYRNDWRPLGLGIVEIGVAFIKNDGTGKPWHACPARFLAPSVAAQLTAALASIHAAWEAEKGEASLYDEDAQPILGCTTLDDIQG